MITIKQVVEKMDVYDIQVENTNNFYANNILVHNCEIFQASKPKYNAQCCLASINLSEQTSVETIANSTRVLTKALNRVIDINKWSDEWSAKAGLDQRAIAIGVAGMADFFAKNKISFESEAAIQWNKDISETMYKSAVTESNRLAELENRTYPAWKGSRYSNGETYIKDWSPLKQGKPIKLLNSLFLANMPTASSAILLGVFESFEPVTYNFFTRKVGQGEFLVINQYLVKELVDLKLWNTEMIDSIITNKGSVQNIIEIPEDIRYRYKEVWEIPQKTLIDLSIVRNEFIDQSQSLNMYHAEAKYSKISSALMYAWKGGLKTGVYYTRTKSKLDTNTKLASNQIQSTPQKPKDSPFECFGCSA